MHSYVVDKTPVLPCSCGFLYVCRFDRELAFPLPNQTARSTILSIHTRKWSERPSQDLLDDLAAKTVGYCGADLKVTDLHARSVHHRCDLSLVPSASIVCLFQLTHVRQQSMHMMCTYAGMLRLWPFGLLVSAC